MTTITMDPGTARPRHARLLIGGEWLGGENGEFDVFDPYTGVATVRVARASRPQVDAAVDAAAASFRDNPLDPYDRYRILQRAAELVEERRADILGAMIAESGFTVSDAAGEVNRCVQTLEISAEEAKRIHGEMVPLDGAPGQAHRMGFTIRVPRGVVCAITPFNSPLNTVAHKVAPALAAGNTVVLKPASATPVTAELLCRTLLDAGLPPAHINLVHGSGGEVGRWLTENPHIAFYTFTGSTGVGKAIHRAVGLRRTSLELGSIACTIVCEDADLEWALPRCVNAAFRKAGQVCTSVQRLYVHESVLDRFAAMLVDRTRAAGVGDPRDPGTLVGPMINDSEAERAETWVAEAVDGGAELVLGGARAGAVLQPTILAGVRKDMRVMAEEVFAPVISLVPYRSFEAAIDQVNDTPYGLAAGVFTRDINRALKAARRLVVGGVHINETSSSRVDLMPYGGTKDSGFGLEGPRYAIREMTEERLVTVSVY